MEENYKPQICLIDLEEITINKFKDLKYNIFKGTLGKKIEINRPFQNTRFNLKLNYELPPNIHEYDIVVLNLKYDDIYLFNVDEHSKIISGTKEHYFVSKYPENVFNPRPASTKVLKSFINKFKKKYIFIVFSDHYQETTYTPVTIKEFGEIEGEEYVCNNYMYLESHPNLSNKYGEKINILDNTFSSLFNKHKSQIYYNIIIQEPQIYRNGEWIIDPNFKTILKNLDNETISFINILKIPDSYNYGLYLLFPQIQNKYDFLSELFEDYLPSLFPDFPFFSSKQNWINNEKYYLPNTENLLREKTNIDNLYNDEIKRLDKKIEKNRKDFQFLHDLILETDEKLVDAVEKYLKWLVFKNVINLDIQKADDSNKKSSIKEEDLQVELDNGLLVIEVKGIGGSSNDSDCREVGKYKHRREKERKKFDVFGLYIVNHQRFVSPESRTNPPFSHKQIEDAIGEERGLVTTYELFKLYFDIEDGWISKEQAKKNLLEYGLVKFIPDNIISIGKPKEIHGNGKIIIFDLKNHKITKDQTILLKDNERYIKANILNIKLNDEDVNEIDNGEVGILSDKKATLDFEIFIKME